MVCIGVTEHACSGPYDAGIGCDSSGTLPIGSSELDRVEVDERGVQPVRVQEHSRDTHQENRIPRNVKLLAHLLCMRSVRIRQTDVLDHAVRRYTLRAEKHIRPQPAN